MCIKNHHFFGPEMLKSVNGSLHLLFLQSYVSALVSLAELSAHCFSITVEDWRFRSAFKMRALNLKFRKETWPYT